jgi:basic membrane lipoprotein Med (substrate-binding protein (PBP1-ABC) superfamily)
VLVDELGLEPTPLLRELQEQILVQDPALDLPSEASVVSSLPGGQVDNPYKGLRAFTEADAATFYGRNELIATLSSIVTADAGLTAVVGPSGSGKSSLVQAGLIPALRDHDPSWVIASMRPGAYPFTELEVALDRAVGEPTSVTNGWGHESDVLRAVLSVLGERRSRLLLVIDQFEELFVLVDDDERDRFLRSLIALATDPQGRSRVLVTLRADFYDRPLMYPAFGRLMTDHVVNVMPLAPHELESAAIGPASSVGVSFERGLLAALIDEVSGQPNALPLFQYTLTELFDHREDAMLTMAAYATLGGIRGAVASGAETIYEGLDEQQREATRQLFMRLVTVGRHSDTRRVVLASELTTLDVDTVVMHAAVEAFVTNRLLVRDRDALSGALTLEVAHEALLSEWERLRRWIDDGRDDLRQHAVYAVAVDDWLTAGRDPDYLLTGGRLEQFEQWRAATTMQLTVSEREFLDDAARRRDDADAAARARTAEQAKLRRRARRHAFALGAVAAAIATGAIAAIVALTGAEQTSRVAFIASNDSADNESALLFEQGLVRAERDFDVEVARAGGADAADIVAASDNDLVIVDSNAGQSIAPDDLDPNAHYVVTDYEGVRFDRLPNVTTQHWAYEEAGFLAGVAAATTTSTGTIGFLGADRSGSDQEQYRAGFEAGARSIDPGIRILSGYLTGFGYTSQPYDVPAGAREVAGRLYEAGADVIFHVAGRSDAGVLDAASELSTTKRWTIGVGSDLFQAATTRQRTHILMSIVRRFDVQMYGIIDDYLAGKLEAEAQRLSVADGMITYVTNGDALSASGRDSVDRAIAQFVSGEIEPPVAPDGALTEREALLAPGMGIGSVGDIPVTFVVPDGWDGGEGWGVTKGDPAVGVIFMEVANTYNDSCPSVALDPPVGPTVDDLASVWANYPAFEATVPTDVSVDGFDGKQVEFTVPDFNEDDCPYGEFMLLEGVDTPGDGYWAQGPNQVHQLRIVDVDGTRVVIAGIWFPDTPVEDRADIDTILDSIQIG